MDPSQWGNVSRMAANAAASSSGINEQDILSHYLMSPAQRDAARQQSLETARLHSLGLATAIPAGAAQQAARDQLVLETMIAARRSTHPTIQALLAQGGNNTTAHDEHDDVKLKIPDRSAPLPTGNIKLENITEPHPHDVLCGRGSSINQHPGNENYRQLVQSLKVPYLVCNKKKEKALLAEDVIRAVRSQNPPGRFLQFNIEDGMWFDIGVTRSREKTSQAFREGLPDIREDLGKPPHKRPKIHPARRMLPMHSRNSQGSTEQQPDTSFPAPSSVGPLNTAASVAAPAPTNRSLFAAPPPTGTASVLDGLHAQSRDELSVASLTRAVGLNPTDHAATDQSRNNRTPAAEQLAAQIMAAHVREQEAKAARVAAGRPTSLPAEVQVPTEVSMSCCLVSHLACLSVANEFSLFCPYAFVAKTCCSSYWPRTCRTSFSTRSS